MLIAKVLQKPQSVSLNNDGTVSVRGLKLAYYLTRVAKNSKNKMKIFGTLVRAEAAGSRPKAKKYLDDTMKEMCTSLVLKVFHADTYLTTAKGVGTLGNKLMMNHIQECADFATCKQRYLAWLKELDV